ncbi:MAG: transglutaminase-like domain-containing protein [Syntrophorhabdales bacterium]
MSKKVFISILVLCTFIVFLTLKLKGLHQPPKDRLQLSAQYMERAGAQESVYGIYIQNLRIGQLKRIIIPARHGYKILEEGRMNIRFLEEKSELAMNLFGDMDEEFRVRTFLFQINSGKDVIDIKGEVQNGEAIVSMLARGQSNVYHLPMKESPILVSAIIPYLVKKGFNEDGKKALSIPIFDPSTLASYNATIELLGWEKVKVADEVVRAFHVKTVFKGLEIHGWVDEGGSVVKELSPLGLTIQKEGKGKQEAGFFDARLFSSIETTGRIEDPRHAGFLKVRIYAKEALKKVIGRYYDLQGDLLEISATKPGTMHLDPALYLSPSAFVNSDDSQIRAAARSIVKDRRTPREKVQAIQEWVYKNVKKVPTFSLPTAGDVFVKRVGDCNEHAVLFAALARAAGIPCAIASGMVYASDGFYYHAWNLVHVEGAWAPVDSTFGQSPADATHIVLAVGDISDAIEIMQFLTNIRIQVVEAR